MKVNISMKMFVIKTLQCLQHNFLTRPQYAPHQWTFPMYGQNRQYAKPLDLSPKLDKKGIKRVQIIVNSFLYYARDIDITTLVEFNEIAASQAAPTQ